MSTKVLVADDSLTIQKVISITLSTLDYDVLECYDDKALFDVLKKEKFDIILLDFNLSDERSVYEICAEIRKQDNSVKIMAMLGTFDSVDSDQASKVFLNDYIVKPFESAKFINKLRTLTSTDGPIEQNDDVEEDLIWEESSHNFEQNKFDSHFSEDEDEGLGEWQVETPGFGKEGLHEKTESSINDLTAMGVNLLKQELSGWGVEVPGVIGKNQTEGMIPPIIDGIDPLEADPKEEGTGITKFVPRTSVEDYEESAIELKDNVSLEDELGEVTGNIDISEMDLESEPQMVPEDDDLAYPEQSDIEEEIEFQNDADDDLEDRLTDDLTTKLISLDDLNIEEEDKLVEDQLEVTEDEINLSSLTSESRSDLVRDIEDEIGPDEFWATDVITPLEIEENDQILEEMEEEEFQIPKKHLEESLSTNFSKSIEEAQKALAEIESSPAQKISDYVNPSSERTNDDVNFNIDKESFKKSLSSQQGNDSINVPVIDEEKIISSLKGSLKAMIEETVKQYCSESIEKVAWEVIPDLAENIIKKELDEIAQSVKSSADS
ncbi:MAG: response regulator [Halobacteriovoraceae bacterium]|nr:response regulator [Halobacteriovoraceae bacterium]